MKAVRDNVARVVSEPLGGSLTVEDAVVATAREVNPAILESSLHSGQFHRYSILASDPIDEFRLDDATAGCPFAKLARRMAEYPSVENEHTNLPFRGGWIGFFSYESGLAAQAVNTVHSWDLPLPLAQLFLYDTAAVYDHAAESWTLVAVDWPKPIRARRAAATDRLARLRGRLLEHQNRSFLEEPSAAPMTDLQPAMTPDIYYRKVARAKRYIEAGDIYQVNLTQRFTARVQADPLSIYRHLRHCNPSSHAAFLPWRGAAIISASPELFLELRGKHVITRPIKGTRPRTGVADSDADARRDLNASPKDRAELTMIVDLLRNDLGRVCEFGSVKVLQAGEIEQHPTLFHRTATIQGHLRSNCNWHDLLAASFPAGSITGAPKIRAMQIIDELEASPRGVYCGSIGLIGLDGSMSLNVAIRTMVHTGSEVHVNAGGAIVADSVAEQEYEEMMAKASGMLSALGYAPHRIHSGLQEATA